MNEAKTEFAHVYLADPSETDDDGDPLRGREKWRTRKLLGSLVCSCADIDARCTAGNIAFRSFQGLWIHGKNIPLAKKLQLYNRLEKRTLNDLLTRET